MANLSYPYLDRSRQYLVDLVQHLLEHSEAVIFIEGSAGSGRTTLVQYIEQKLIQPTADQPGAIATYIDDADLLPEVELARLLAPSHSKRLIITGLPGACETINQAGYFNEQPVARLTMAPFTRADADHFISEYCAPVSVEVRQRLIDQYRLYPGELQQATYDNELAHGRPAKSRVKKKAALLAISLLGLLVLIWVGILQKPGVDQLSALSAQTTTTAETKEPVIRARSINPPGAVLSKPKIPGQSNPDPAKNPPEKAQPVAPPPVQPAPVIIPKITETLPEFQLPKLDRDGLLELNPQHWTLQVMLATKLENIDQLVARFNLDSKSYRYAKIVDHKLLFCLIYGDFDSYEAAGASIQRMPVALQQMGPWRRQFQAIQFELSGSPKK